MPNQLSLVAEMRDDIIKGLRNGSLDDDSYRQKLKILAIKACGLSKNDFVIFYYNPMGCRQDSDLNSAGIIVGLVLLGFLASPAVALGGAVVTGGMLLFSTMCGNSRENEVATDIKAAIKAHQARSLAYRNIDGVFFNRAVTPTESKNNPQHSLRFNSPRLG